MQRNDMKKQYIAPRLDLMLLQPETLLEGSVNVYTKNAADDAMTKGRDQQDFSSTEAEWGELW